MSHIRPAAQTSDGVFIDLGPDGPAEVRIGGSPIIMGGGWSPLHAYVGLPSFRLLELIREDGARATWILDIGNNRIAGPAAELPEPARERLVAEVRALLSAAVGAMILAVDPRAEVATEYFALSLEFRTELENLCGSVAPPEPQWTWTHDAADSRLAAGDHGQRLEGLDACLEPDLQRRYLAACQAGRMSWPSPVDGGEIDDIHGLVVSPLIEAWRCVDRRHGLVFYVIAAGFDQETAAVYIPASSILVSLARTRFTQIAIPPGPLVTWLTDHVVAHGPDLLAFLAAPVKRFAQYTWPVGSAHIGHYVWNELPGLERIVNGLSPEHYPVVYDLGGAGGSSFYGALVHLYPELQGSILHRCLTLADMSRDAYAIGIQPLRFSGVYVSAELRQRIVNLIAQVPAMETARAALWGGAGPVVVFGLRVENRTMTNLADFYVGVGKALARRFGNLTVILDGHNRRHGAGPAATFDSFLEHRADRRPMDVEIEVAEAIRSGLRDDSVTIVDCVGMTVPDNVAWLSQAHFCVTPWGAGQSKYRWVCNLPSYVTLNRFSLRHKGDVHIYHSPDFVEDPTTLMLATTDVITDRPETPVLVPMDAVHVPYYVNYEVDVAAAARQIGEAMEGLPTAGVWPRRRPHAAFDIRNDVIVSPEGELFLCSGGHHVLDQVLGYRAPLKRSIATFIDNINGRATAATAIGALYLHVICPDKQSVLPKSLGVPDPICLGDHYEARCGEVWSRVLYPKATLRENSEGIFQHTDTHMSHRGTLMTVREILRRLYGHRFDAWAADKQASLRPGAPAAGDLGRKLSPPIVEGRMVMDADPRIHFFNNQMNTGNNGAVQISVFAQAPITERLLFIGDSFGRDLTWVLAEIFQETVFLRSPYMHAEFLTAMQPRVVITENVERYLGTVQSDVDRPEFLAMNEMAYGETPERRAFAEAMSALCGPTRAPYRRLMDRLLLNLG